MQLQAFRHRLYTATALRTQTRTLRHSARGQEVFSLEVLTHLSQGPGHRIEHIQRPCSRAMQPQRCLTVANASASMSDTVTAVNETTRTLPKDNPVLASHDQFGFGPTQKRGIEDFAAADESLATPEPRQEAKRRKPLPPAPAIVGRGSAFSPDVWQNAALLVDKPKGWTSFDVCAKLRGALKTKKVGHAGTLDPMATGLLIICTGRGTKAIDGFVAMEKAYSGTLRLGQATPSYDAETDVSSERPWEHITDEAIEAAKAAFVGSIMQQPPMYSAVSIKGERLYVAARKGIEVDRPARPVTVHSFSVQRSAASAQDLDFNISCSKGTYIRSLAHDLGQALGCGAHLTALRRESIGAHSVAGAWELADLVEAAQKARNA